MTHFIALRLQVFFIVRIRILFDGNVFNDCYSIAFQSCALPGIVGHQRFAHLLLPSRGNIAFAFWSHKVLRWIGPFLILMDYLCSFALSFDSVFYRTCFWIQTILLAVPLVDALLQKLKINFPGLRYISHFYVMNLALLNGFFKFLKGVKNNVWTPTERNQS